MSVCNKAKVVSPSCNVNLTDDLEAHAAASLKDQDARPLYDREDF